MFKGRIAIIGVLLTGVMLSCGSFDLMPPSDGFLWVAFTEAVGSNDLHILEPTTGRSLRKLPYCGVGGRTDDTPNTGRMNWGGGRLWATGVTDDGSYWCEIDPETGKSVERFDAPGGSVGGGIAWDGSKLWFTDRINFYTIDPDTNTHEWQFDTGWHGEESAYHINFGITWDGKYLWSVGSQRLDGNEVYLYQFDVTRNEEVRRIKIDFLLPQDGPRDLAYDGEAFWVTTFRDGGKIFRVSPIDGHFLGYIEPYLIKGDEVLIEKPFAVAFDVPSE